MLLIGLSCCKKEDSIIKDVPVEYYLTDSQKAIFKNFETDTVTFISEDDKSINFVSKGITDYVSHSETDSRKGEALSVYYSADTDYLPNFFVGYHLMVLEDGTCKLLITFGTETFWTERKNDFKFSHFHLNPNSSNILTDMANVYMTRYMDSNNEKDFDFSFKSL